MTSIYHRSISRLKYLVLIFLFLFLSQNLVEAAQSVTLAWDPTDPAPDGYSIYQRLEGENYNYTSPVWPLQGDDPTKSSCLIEGLDNETTYYFVVRATKNGIPSGDSNEVLITTGAVPQTTYAITTNKVGIGTVSPSSAAVNAGGSQTFTITPGAGYDIENVFVDGVSIGRVSTHTIDQIDCDHVIRAVFTERANDSGNYVLSVSAGTGGSISDSGQINVVYGENWSFFITPSSGYRIADVLVDGTSVGATSGYTFMDIRANHTIAASFAAEGFVIEASAGEGGTISPSGNIVVSAQTNKGFQITPDEGYEIESLMIDGSPIEIQDAYQFSNVSDNHTIQARFKAVSVAPPVDTGGDYILTVSAGTGGSISDPGQINVVSGENWSFFITPNSGYSIADVVVDGTSVGATSGYTFMDIRANHTIEASFKTDNQAPTADAGPDQVVSEQAFVTLSGLNSKDLDDGIASFEWRQLGGVSVDLSGYSEDAISFTAPDVDVNGEALEFELVVTDTKGLESSDRCIVNVTWVNEPPVADAGTDQSVNEGGTIVLNASGTMDPDDGIDTYAWRQTSGPQVVLVNPSSASPSFKAPDVGPQGASLVFELTATDNGGLQDTDGCVVAVTWDNMEPLADAGHDQQVMAGSDVVLDGTRSMDPDGLNLKYQWRQTFGSPVVLSDATAASPRFTAPDDALDGKTLTFELTVTDSGGLQGADVCDVSVQGQDTPADTTPPTLTVDNPSKGWALVFKNWYTIMGSAADDGQVSKVTWKSDRGDSGEFAGTAQWSETIKLYRGANIITITATDASGNQQSKEILIYRIRWSY